MRVITKYVRSEVLTAVLTKAEVIRALHCAHLYTNYTNLHSIIPQKSAIFFSNYHSHTKGQPVR